MGVVTTRGAAYGVLALSLGCAVVGRALSVSQPSLDPGDPDSPYQIALETVWLGYGVLGAVILGRRPKHPIGWILLATGAVIGLSHLGAGYAAWAYAADPDRPGAAVALWIPSTWWAPALLLPLVFVPLLFPDGHLPGPRWRLWAWGAGVVAAMFSAGFLFAAGDLDEPPGPENPLGLPGASSLQVLGAALPLLVGLGVAAVGVRRRHAVGDEREQLRWLTLAAGVAATCAVALVFAGPWGPVPQVITLVAITVIPVAVTVAIVRYRLYDIDVVINRTLVYGGMTAAVLTAYAVVVLFAGRLLGAEVEWRQSVLVTALIAMAAYPLRGVLQRAVNRFMYGDRDDPYAAMSRLAQRLADAVSPAGLLEAVAETVGQTLRIPYVAVELEGGSMPARAAYGTPRGDPVRMPMVHQGESVGTLVLSPRGPGESFTAADRQVLEDVVRQAAVAAHAVRLAQDLQHARERLVLAREEERRRLRRDLHDGVASALAGITLYAGNARRALGTDGSVNAGSVAEATDWLARLEGHAADAVGDVRRVINDLRPPALDELGLCGALQAWAATAPIRIDVQTPELPRLTAGVEVAAYRIAVEAAMNAVRHAEAASCRIRITADDVLGLEIIDDGRGIQHDARQGVGLVTMRERAEELGGTCYVVPNPEGGTIVRARLPLDLEREEP